jgi:hypothetical protein
MTPSEPGGMQNTRQVSTTTSRRNLSTKTGNLPFISDCPFKAKCSRFLFLFTIFALHTKN